MHDVQPTGAAALPGGGAGQIADAGAVGQQVSLRVGGPRRLRAEFPGGAQLGLAVAERGLGGAALGIGGLQRDCDLLRLEQVQRRGVGILPGQGDEGPRDAPGNRYGRPGRQQRQRRAEPG